LTKETAVKTFEVRFKGGLEGDTTLVSIDAENAEAAGVAAKERIIQDARWDLTRAEAALRRCLSAEIESIL
jgi:hypothetical protein